MNRFDGKKLVNRPVSDGIRKTEELINLAISGEAPTFHGSDSAQATKRIQRKVQSVLVSIKI